MAKIMTLQKDVSMIGELQSESSVRLEGRFEGNGIVKNALYVAKGARWDGNVIAELLIVKGEVHGDVAANRVILLEGSRATGSIVSTNIQIQRGAVYTGALRMRKVRKTAAGVMPERIVPSNLVQITGT